MQKLLNDTHWTHLIITPSSIIMNLWNHKKISVWLLVIKTVKWNCLLLFLLLLQLRLLLLHRFLCIFLLLLLLPFGRTTTRLDGNRLPQGHNSRQLLFFLRFWKMRLPFLILLMIRSGSLKNRFLRFDLIQLTQFLLNMRKILIRMVTSHFNDLRSTKSNMLFRWCLRRLIVGMISRCYFDYLL